MPLNFITSQFIVWGAVALVGVPAAVLLFDKRNTEKRIRIQWTPGMSSSEWLSKLVVVVIVYELLYFRFGYL
ncbi:hypothetical protein [Rhodohalobacter sulfatireducens]|uniref:Uncharacterized protein n=1 Tax=Rhodohalobacter sulfatireducens TaxID=2911366 RepID=A0ABS9KGB9_9BACT|nr:hypothetical protein [Rhodohalobacter sulfatireducens]MCG2589893.1 hypothetical protein [Rhodohalobacter sulfatireducens]